MPRFGLVGPAYQSQSVNADAQRCVNWYPEKDESGEGRSEWQLLPTPGLKTAYTLPTTLGASSSPIRGMVRSNIGAAERVFAVGGPNLAATHADPQPQGANLFELFADGSAVEKTRLGPFTVDVAHNQDDSGPVSIAVGNGYVAIANAGILWCLHLATNVLTWAQYSGGTDPVYPVKQVVFLDQYFIVLMQDSNEVRFSALGDPTTFDALDVFQVSITADNVLSMIVDHRELILCGSVDTVVYSNTGDADNPFQPNPAGFIQQGIAAADTLVRLDNTVFFIGGDDRGVGMGWRLNGYVPQRVTTYAIETAWQGYPTLADAVAYPYQDQGHAFWVIYFPTADKTWAYDVANGTWHEREHRDPTTGQPEAHRSWVHTFAFGKHLVGDWQTARIYEMRIPTANGSGGWDFATDFGDLIRHNRRSPHMANEGERIYVSELQVFLESGLGPIPPLRTAVTYYDAPPLALVNVAGQIPAGTYDIILEERDGGGGTLGLSEDASKTFGAPRVLQVAIPNADVSTWRIWLSSDGQTTWKYYDAAGPIVGDFSISATVLAAMIAGTPPDSSILYRAPQIDLAISRDGGHSFGNPLTRDCGMAGDFQTRVRWLRLGQARDFVFELSCSDPIPWRIIDGSIFPDYPSSRLATNLRKQA